jgi:DeoR family transcriptional regulator, aga operon transcriptional repressor
MAPRGVVLPDRTEEILKELLRTGEVSVAELVQQLNISPATVRRALRSLERKGLLRRTHGGAVPLGPSLYEPFRHVSSFQEQEKHRMLEKRQIGLAAAELVDDGDTIAIGAGTTATQVARSIRHRKGITIVTNAINIAMELSHRDDLKVMVTGGWVSGSWFALVGPGAIHTAGEMFVDKAFIGVDGIHAERGLTTNYPDQATIHRAMVKQARRTIVVADHHKLGVIGTALICPIRDVQSLITDRAAPDEAVAPFTAAGLDVRRA